MNQEDFYLIGSQALTIKNKEKVGINPTYFFAIKNSPGRLGF